MINNLSEKNNKTVREKYFSVKHPSGLEIIIIPKNHSTAYGIIGTRYGSMDRTFKTDDDADFITVPDGIAHFLEHKLFENENGEDAFTRFGRYGGDSNAFTSFDKTAYLFSCTDNFEENLGILIDFVQAPYFTDKSVQKEIGIIGQEIKMYDDDPGWQSFFTLLNALYKNNPVKIDIAGTVESISKITPEILYRCYNTFYNLNNMTLVVCGDITPQQVLGVADKYLKPSKDINIERTAFDEPWEVNQKRITKNLEVAMPILAIGVKDKTPELGAESLKRNAANDIILHAMFGGSSEFYTRVYEKGLITPTFSSAYDLGRGFALSIISGSTTNPDQLYSEVMSEIEKNRVNGLNRSDFERSKKVIYSSNLKSFESTEGVAYNFLSHHFLGSDLLDYPETIASITYDYASEIYEEMYKEAHIASSVILPNKK